MVGRTLNHYEILEPLGSGGMGEVYVARDQKLGRRVALKVLPTDLAEDPERLERFEREARTLAALNHPNIVTVYSVEEAGGIRFMTMELIEGQTLDSLIPPDGLEMGRFLELAVPLADAIAAAHERGVQHRDLKPPNVMVTDDGRVKVLDFGLAKLRDESAGPEGMTQMITGELTGEGKIVGTVAYMSPEQAEGKPLDHRSDIFSLGILLYEMATGVRPFQGDTNLSVLSSILKDEPDSISDVRDNVPIPLARVIQRALAKKVDRRYQSAADLRHDLADLRRDLESGEVVISGIHERPGTLDGTPPWLKVAALLAAVVVITGLGWFLLGRGGPEPPPGPTVATVADRGPGVGVFLFENISDDADLDWLRNGLTDMLVTDLSQSPNLSVLGTDRLYAILEDLGRRDDPNTSAEVVQAVARRTDIDTAVLGSFARAGEMIRINARVQDVATGEVLVSERVEGRGEESIFALVDDLTRRIRRQLDADFETAMADAAGLDGERDRDLTEVTTDSVEAYKLYLEGVRYNEDSKEELAVPMFERALEMDPDFAMAHAKLSVSHGNLGDMEAARMYARQAYEMADQLPERERYYIQGRYLSMDPETGDEAVEAYRRAVEQFPDHRSARHNLALQLRNRGRVEEAIQHYEELRRRGMPFAATYRQLADAYANTGRLEESVEVLLEYVEENPDNAEGHQNLGRQQARLGRLDEAMASLERAAALDPDPTRAVDRWGVHVLAADWDAAAAAEQILIDSEDRRDRNVGWRFRSIRHQYRGRLTEARSALERALVAAGDEASIRRQTIGAQRYLAQQLEDWERVLELTDQIETLVESPQDAQGVHADRALAAAALGREEQSRRAYAAFFDLISEVGLPADLERGIRGQIDGALAFMEDDWETAARELTVGLEGMTDRETSDQAILLHYYLARSLERLGRVDEASDHYHAIVESTLQRLGPAILWVRSLDRLASILDARGDADAAARLWRRYLAHWGDGEIDAERVAAVRARLR